MFVYIFRVFMTIFYCVISYVLDEGVCVRSMFIAAVCSEHGECDVN